MIFYLWVSRDIGSCISGARRAHRGLEGGAGGCTLAKPRGLRSWMSAHDWGVTLFCRSAPALVPLDPPHPLSSLDSKVIGADHRSPSTPTLGSVPAVAGMLSASAPPDFPWALCVPRASQQLLGEERVFCALWKVLEHFCPRSPALVTTVRGQCLGDGEGTRWHYRAQFQNACPGYFLHFLQDDAGLQYGAPLLSSQVSTGGTTVCRPLGFPSGSSTVPSHPLKQKQWPCPQPVPLGLLKGQARIA